MVNTSPTKYIPQTKFYSSNNLSDKISKTKNELLNLKKEDQYVTDFESKRMINRNNLHVFTPRNKDEGYKNFINNAVSNFKPTIIHSKPKDTNTLANRIFNRNKSPLKLESDEPLCSTFRRQNKMDLFKARNEIVFNKKRHMFAERKSELINLLKAKPGVGSFDSRGFSPDSGRNQELINRKSYGVETKLDTFIEKQPALSLKQMDTNLKYSKIDFCTYYASQPKISLKTSLNDYKFNKIQNQMARILGKFS